MRVLQVLLLGTIGMQVMRQCLRVDFVIIVAFRGGLAVGRRIGQENFIGVRGGYLTLMMRAVTVSHAAQVQGCGMRWLCDHDDTIGVTLNHVRLCQRGVFVRHTSVEVTPIHHLPSLTKVLCRSSSHA